MDHSNAARPQTVPISSSDSKYTSRYKFLHRRITWLTATITFFYRTVKQHPPPTPAIFFPLKDSPPKPFALLAFHHFRRPSSPELHFHLSHTHLKFTLTIGTASPDVLLFHTSQILPAEIYPRLNFRNSRTRSSNRHHYIPRSPTTPRGGIDSSL